jgi:diacylglycerol kinase (ATP)
MKSQTIVESFRCAFAGLWYVLTTQRNARIHLLFAAAAVGLGVWLKLDLTEWAVLALTIGFVLASEMLNTVAETLVDLISPGYHPLARIVKDVTAGAVLLSAMTAVAVGVLILGVPLLNRLWRG